MATWPLTGVTIGPALASHPTRQVAVLHSDQGDFVVKVDPAPRPDLPVGDHLRVLDQLGQCGFGSAPEVLRTRTGRSAAVACGGAACVTEYLPHPLASSSEPRAPAWRNLGLIAAALNATVCPIPFAVPVDAALDDLAQRARGEVYEAPLLKALGRAGEVGGLAATALIHGEINEANTRRRADKTVVLVDWDQAGSAPAALEYGYPLIQVFVSEDLGFDAESASAFYRGYLDGGGLIDRDQVFNSALFHALRYLWWGDTQRRWKRIAHAIDHEAEICAVIP
jgi:hypothetical protein